MAEYPEKLQELVEGLELVGDRNDRIDFLIEIADRFREVPPRIAVRPFPEDRKVPACESQAYVWAEPNPDGTLKYHFAVENPQGLSAKAFAAVLALECEDVAIRSSIVRVGPTSTGFAEGWDLEQFAEIIPQWNRFGIQRHFNTLRPEDVAGAVVSVVTAPPHVWVPVVEVQPQPPDG